MQGVKIYQNNYVLDDTFDFVFEPETDNEEYAFDLPRTIMEQ